ncbi:MAG: ATP-binding protein [Deltaproteobacteria bacterium]|nr:ATP-binding protein [Deltaproteobacteria bacterium]
MLEILKTIILDFQVNNFEVGIPRKIIFEKISKKASIFIGVRRSGKSYFLNQIIDNLLRTGVPKTNILYFDFFDDRLSFFNKDNLQLILDAYFQLYPLNQKSQVYYFFDEIQVVDGWESFVNRLLQNGNNEVYITGSSSKMLSKEIATQMRGRSLSWEIFPFSFAEFCFDLELNEKSASSSQEKYLLQNKLEEYLIQGGFPEVLNVSDKLRLKIHQEYLETILFRDIIERHNSDNPQAIYKLAVHLINNISSLYSINNLVNYLSSIGFKVSKQFVGEVITWFHDAYFLFPVKLFSTSLNKQNVNPKKIYCIDHSFVSSISTSFNSNFGSKIENLVFIHLCRNFQKINYYKTKNGKEVDFIVSDKLNDIKLIQVCDSVSNEKTLERETSALFDAMTEMGLKKSSLITRNEEKIIKKDAKEITIIPLWKFLIS